LQLIMVDDASTDTSLTVLQSLPVEVVSHARSLGQNGAILSGMAHARAPLTCVLDADLQDPPEAMPELIARLRQGDVQVVFSSRKAPFRLSSRVFRGVARAIFPNLPETPCLCFAIDEDARASVLRVASAPDYLVAVIGALAVRTASVPVVRALAPDARRGQHGLRRWRYAARMLRSLSAWKWKQTWKQTRQSHSTRSEPVTRDAQERSRPVRAR
jgi:glycosyltransferase involved in cell wall biosynthesis